MAVILIITAFLYALPYLNRAANTYTNKVTYDKVLKEKEEQIHNKEAREFDWIKINNTNINYPIVWKNQDNNYYLNHDIYGNQNNHGAIYYDGSNEPYSSHTTIIYGHCMKDGSMFNNLHIFKNSQEKFLNSELLIERKDGTDYIYKPLGLYVTNTDFFYHKLDDMKIDEAIKLIQEKSIYDMQVTYNEDTEIIVLMTCSYDNEGDRLFVFYISE